jgi:hypothetical protein
VTLAQDEGPTDSNNHDDSFHSVTLVIGSAFMANSFSDNSNDVLVVPAYGLNYDYQINRKWGVGVHTDILLQQFKIEKHDSHEEVVRENPVSIAAILFYKPHHRWKIIGGYGIEMETHENFQLVRIGVEYSIELPKKWELDFMFENDFKINGYYTMLLGVGFTKKFVKQH